MKVPMYAKTGYAVVHIDNCTEVLRKFEEKGEAYHHITDCYGPESSQYTVVELVTIEGKPNEA